MIHLINCIYRLFLYTDDILAEIIKHLLILKMQHVSYTFTPTRRCSITKERHRSPK